MKEVASSSPVAMTFINRTSAAVFQSPSPARPSFSAISR